MQFQRRTRTAAGLSVVFAVVFFGCAPSAWADPVLADPQFGTLTLVAQDPVGLQLVDGVAFDRFGNLFATREAFGTSGGVSYVNVATGAVTRLTDGSGPLVVIQRADYIALHPSGDFFVASEVTGDSTTNRLFRVQVNYGPGNLPTGTATLTSVVTSLALNNPEGLVVLAANGPYGNVGDLYIAEDLPGFGPGSSRFGRILRVNPADGTTTVLVDTTAGLNRPEGLTFGDFGGTTAPALFTAETLANRILRIDPDGTVSVVGDPSAVGLIQPDNLRFGPDGFLYVTEDQTNGRIIRIAPDGTHTVFATGLNAPQGLIFDPVTGDLYVSEQNAARIWRISSVPEPTSLVMAVLAAAVMFAQTLRRRQRLGSSA